MDKRSISFTSKLHEKAAQEGDSLGAYSWLPIGPKVPFTGLTRSNGWDNSRRMLQPMMNALQSLPEAADIPREAWDVPIGFSMRGNDDSCVGLHMSLLPHLHGAFIERMRGEDATPLNFTPRKLHRWSMLAEFDPVQKKRVPRTAVQMLEVDRFRSLHLTSDAEASVEVELFVVEGTLSISSEAQRAEPTESIDVHITLAAHYVSKIAAISGGDLNIKGFDLDCPPGISEELRAFVDMGDTSPPPCCVIS